MWLLFQDMQTLPEEGVETQSALDVILQSGTVGIAIMVILLVLFFLLYSSWWNDISPSARLEGLIRIS